jgi:hypothetical protein
MAFGPGLTIESAVLEKVPAKRPLAKVTLDSCLAAP